MVHNLTHSQEFSLTLKTFNPFTIQEKSFDALPNYRYVVFNNVGGMHNNNTEISVSIVLVPMVIAVLAITERHRTELVISLDHTTAYSWGTYPRLLLKFVKVPEPD